MNLTFGAGIFLLLLTIAGCSELTTPDTDKVQVVEAYLAGRVESNRDVLQSLICSELEHILPREANSFATVDATIDKMVCTGVDDDTVACDGAIVAVYDGENTTFPLTTYRVVEEDGAWRWCGEAG